jgi:hypothetical protein
MRIKFLLTTLTFSLIVVNSASAQSAVKKISDLIIYHNPAFYSAFPSIVTRPNGELIVAFRRAPERKVFGEKGSSHTDPNSYLVLVRSQDDGKTWTEDPELIFAHPYGGSQDPCMIQLNDGTLLCGSYGWARVNDDAKKKFNNELRHDNFIFMGGYLVRSRDNGKSWEGPIIPPPVPGTITTNVFGDPAPAYNRGAMHQDSSGRIYWAVAKQSRLTPRITETHMMTSDDQGSTWQYSAPIAQDAKASFNETSLYETPKGDIIAFMRTADFNDQTVIARSKDRGKSFLPWKSAGWQGHPHYALRIPDDRVFLIYGYRHKPYGIRARILNAECTDFETAEEIIIRKDGTGSDLGYPWATMTADGKILAVYYFHDAKGTRHIAGSLFSVE